MKSSLAPASVAENPGSSTFAWADRLRNIATIMVIAIHVSAPVAQEYTLYNTWHWWAGNLWDSFSRPGVPLFVMLSGYLLLGKDYPLGDFLQKRFTRVLMPALFWMIAYSVYNHFAHRDPATLGAALKKIAEGPVHYHLWFIYLIVGLYVSYPVLRPWIRGAQERDFMYFFALCVSGTWVYKILYYFWGVEIGVYYEFFTNHAGHFVLGYYLGNKALPGETPPVSGIAPWRFGARTLRRVAMALILLGSAATAVGTWWASTRYGGTFHPFFYDYLTPNVGIASIGWFLLARYAWNARPLFDIEKEFAAMSFGIYLIHVFVMDWWSESGYWHSVKHPLRSIPIIIGYVVIVSFIGVALIRTLPGGKKVT